eukprot:sb/3478598/
MKTKGLNCSRIKPKTEPENGCSAIQNVLATILTDSMLQDFGLGTHGEAKRASPPDDPSLILNNCRFLTALDFAHYYGFDFRVNFDPLPVDRQTSRVFSS